ncbi:MAG: hypothetical protein JG768_520 [Fusobacteriales bacterium]|jgi:hypothetical protein|nr:hypothetical protein [Fusobacteriales bacterium]
MKKKHLFFLLTLFLFGCTFKAYDVAVHFFNLKDNSVINYGTKIIDENGTKYGVQEVYLEPENPDNKDLSYVYFKSDVLNDQTEVSKRSFVKSNNKYLFNWPIVKFETKSLIDIDGKETGQNEKVLQWIESEGEQTISAKIIDEDNQRDGEDISVSIRGLDFELEGDITKGVDNKVKIVPYLAKNGLTETLEKLEYKYRVETNNSSTGAIEIVSGSEFSGEISTDGALEINLPAQNINGRYVINLLGVTNIKYNNENYKNYKLKEFKLEIGEGINPVEVEYTTNENISKFTSANGGSITVSTDTINGESKNIYEISGAEDKENYLENYFEFKDSFNAVSKIIYRFKLPDNVNSDSLTIQLYSQTGSGWTWSSKDITLSSNDWVEFSYDRDNFLDNHDWSLIQRLGFKVFDYTGEIDFNVSMEIK